jgi:cation-transporting ATPase 13A3/4/5
MAPEHKALLVQSFKQEQCTVLMCGDGANDCSALKAADVGVSLSPEEASIAAHFTSKVPDISCLLKLLREGKGSLATSIQTFKYMMLYSLIQFFIVTLL